MRDKFKGKKFFDDKIQESTEYANETPWEDSIEFYLNDVKNPVLDGGYRGKLVALENAAFSRVAPFIALLYSRGDELSKIYDAHYLELLSRNHYLADALADGHPKKYIFGHGNPEVDFYAKDLHSAYTWLAWCVCLDDNFDIARKIIPNLCRVSEDRLLDIVCGFFQENRDIADEPSFPRAFNLLDQAINANADQRIDLLKQYLDNWPKYIGQINASSIGFVCNQKIDKALKTRSELVENISDRFEGYWAWEAALVVKFFGIDDSSFKDNEFYPYDLVHFRPPLDNQGYLASLDLSSMATISAEDLNPKQRADLILITNHQPEDVVSKKLLLDDTDYIYHGYKPKSDVDIRSSDFDFIVDSSVRYSVKYETDETYIYDMQSQLGYAHKFCSILSKEQENMPLQQLLEILFQKHTDDDLIDEIHAPLNDKNYGRNSWLYYFRKKQTDVPSPVILNHSELDSRGGMLLVTCMVRDLETTYLDVIDHFAWLVARYKGLEQLESVES